MKKNVMMRVASIMLVLVLMSSSVISGTFAKYVTADSVADTARVAKFGVVVTTTGELFSKTYKNVANENVPGGTGDEAILTVVSSGTDKLVAPGTQSKAEGFVFTLTGDPEVDVMVDIDFEVTGEIMLAKDVAFDNPTTGKVGDTYTVANNYYPVIFTVKKDGTQVAQGNVAAIQTYFNGLSHVYEANEMDAAVGTYVLTWAWAFQNTVAAPDQVDVLDTYLGNQAAAGALADMEVTFTCTVTQID